MIQTGYNQGASYILYDEPLNLLHEVITSAQGCVLTPGDKVTCIGKTRRTSFAMAPGHYIVYEGIATINGGRYAIFDSPEKSKTYQQAKLFDKPVQYRYALAMVEIRNVFHCFLIGGPQGCYDVVMDDVIKIN